MIGKQLVSVRVETGLWREVKVRAALDKRSVEATVDEALRVYLGAEDPLLKSGVASRPVLSLQMESSAAVSTVPVTKADPLAGASTPDPLSGSVAARAAAVRNLVNNSVNRKALVTGSELGVRKDGSIEVPEGLGVLTPVPGRPILPTSTLVGATYEVGETFSTGLAHDAKAAAQARDVRRGRVEDERQDDLEDRDEHGF